MHELERRLWLVTVATFFVGDFTLTALVLLNGGVEVAQPAAWFYTQWGLAGLALQKLLFGALLAGIVAPYYWLDNHIPTTGWQYRLAIPGTVVVRASWLAVWNALVVLQLAGVAVPTVIPHPDVMYP